jgi:hypothetical protein
MHNLSYHFEVKCNYYIIYYVIKTTAITISQQRLPLYNYFAIKSIIYAAIAEYQLDGADPKTLKLVSWDFTSSAS